MCFCADERLDGHSIDASLVGSSVVVAAFGSAGDVVEATSIEVDCDGLGCRAAATNGGGGNRLKKASNRG